MITEYMLIYSDDMNDLIAKVNAALQSGWQPIGGVGSVSATDQQRNPSPRIVPALMQAMGK